MLDLPRVSSTLLIKICMMNDDVETAGYDPPPPHTHRHTHRFVSKMQHVDNHCKLIL